MRKFVSIAALAATLATVLGASASAVVKYTVRDLGELSRGAGSVASDINNKGQVAGYSYVSGSSSQHTVIWENDEMTDIGYAYGCSPFDINESGQVLITKGYTKYSLWSNGTFDDFSCFGSKTLSITDINDAGQVVGAYDGAPFIWKNGVVQYVDSIPGTSRYFAGINNNGQIIGSYSQNGSKGFVMKDGVITNLSIIPTAINDLGHMISYNAFYKDGVTASIHTLYSGWSNNVEALNNHDQVVGYSYYTNQFGFPVDGRSYIWENGISTDLNTLLPANTGWTLTTAYDINDNGQIVGWGMYNGQTRGYLLTPVPEPSSACALVMGLTGFVGMITKRRR